MSHLEETIFTHRQIHADPGRGAGHPLLVYTPWPGMPWSDALPFALILLVASVPVALPATFTLATALGAFELAKKGVLVTRLSAIEEAAAMDMLCDDKTGTITENRLALAALQAIRPHTENDLLRLGGAGVRRRHARPDRSRHPRRCPGSASCCPIDRQSAHPLHPFRPADAGLRGVLLQENGRPSSVPSKARRSRLAALAGAPVAPPEWKRLAAGGLPGAGRGRGRGNRPQACRSGRPGRPPAQGFRRAGHALRELGVRVVMVTGDGHATARTVAGPGGDRRSCMPGRSAASSKRRPRLGMRRFRRVFPEDKFRLVQDCSGRGT